MTDLHTGLLKVLAECVTEIQECERKINAPGPVSPTTHTGLILELAIIRHRLEQLRLRVLSDY